MFSLEESCSQDSQPKVSPALESFKRVPLSSRKSIEPKCESLDIVISLSQPQSEEKASMKRVSAKATSLVGYASGYMDPDSKAVMDQRSAKTADDSAFLRTPISTIRENRDPENETVAAATVAAAPAATAAAALSFSGIVTSCGLHPQAGAEQQEPVSADGASPPITTEYSTEEVFPILLLAPESDATSPTPSPSLSKLKLSTLADARTGESISAAALSSAPQSPQTGGQTAPAAEGVSGGNEPAPSPFTAKCAIKGCSYRAETIELLKQHCQDVHDLKYMRCDECMHLAVSWSQLRRHKRQLHATNHSPTLNLPSTMAGDTTSASATSISDAVVSADSAPGGDPSNSSTASSQECAVAASAPDSFSRKASPVATTRKKRQILIYDEPSSDVDDVDDLEVPHLSHRKGAQKVLPKYEPQPKRKKGVSVGSSVTNSVNDTEELVYTSAANARRQIVHSEPSKAQLTSSAEPRTESRPESRVTLSSKVPVEQDTCSQTKLLATSIPTKAERATRHELRPLTGVARSSKAPASSHDDNSARPADGLGSPPNGADGAEAGHQGIALQEYHIRRAKPIRFIAKRPRAVDPAGPPFV